MRVRIHSALTAAATFLTLVPAAFAHEGHGDPALSRSWLHYLAEPAHLPLTVAACVVLVVASKQLLSRAARTRRHRATGVGDLAAVIAAPRP